MCTSEPGCVVRPDGSLSVRRSVGAVSGIRRRSVVVCRRFSQFLVLLLMIEPLGLARVRPKRVIARRGVGQGVEVQQHTALLGNQPDAGKSRLGPGEGSRSAQPSSCYIRSTTLLLSFDVGAS